MLLVIKTVVLNQTMHMGKSQIQIVMISERFEEIRKNLLADLNAGVTMIMMRKAQKGIMCVIPPQNLFAGKEMIHCIDPDPFVTITQTKEVGDRGFTMEQTMVSLSEEI